MNNVVGIKEFIDNKTKSKLLINQVSEEIGFFYMFLIENEALSKSIKLNYRINFINEPTKDLFGKEEIDLCFSNNNKILEKFISSKNKTIIFTDYKNFKKYSGTALAINGYNYHKDLKYYIKKELQIDNSDIIEFCLNNPYLTFSEISKYQANNTGYVKENNIKEDKNFILDIRKYHFHLRRNENKILDIYKNLKKEVRYKKFSFLTC